MKLKTYSEKWSSQGLRYYRGHAWYQTEVKVDEKFDNGNPIRLWFSSIDETATNLSSAAINPNYEKPVKVNSCHDGLFHFLNC